VTNENFVDELKKQKKRVTPARLKMFEVITTSPSPIAADKIIESVGVNKTTVYRDLELFLKCKIIEEADFGDGTKRYELSDLKHHHHLICLRCKKVQDISFEENLDWQESQIKKSQGFQVVRHDLEFFGYCQNCTK
jgi:Fur family ferric uptake transcriptional regulator